MQILTKLMRSHGVNITSKDNKIICHNDTLSLEFLIADERFDFTNISDIPVISQDYLFTAPEKIFSVVLSKLNLNKKVFARNCEIKNIDRTTVESFLNNCHLMGATKSGFNRGLFYKSELVAVASFSKGRKMRRLLDEERSFELIRFCSKSGITVTGGLTKLVKNFCIEKNVGDVMTYVDKQMSDGKSFLNAGFKKHSDIAPHFFLINRTTFERTLLKDLNEQFDSKRFYRIQNFGSIKMIFTPNAKP